MMDAQQTAIAGALAGLMRARRVTVAQLAAGADMVPNTIKNILNGRTMQPRLSTLRELARILAEDSYTGELDTLVMNENERTLAVAAGYAAPEAHEIPTHLELSLYYRLASRERARAWCDAIDALAALSPDEVRALAVWARSRGSVTDDSTPGPATGTPG